MVSTATMDPSALILDMLAWLLTYAVHSTVLILAVWLLAATVIRSHTTRDALWKLALVGGVFTASVQMGLGVRPVFGNVALTQSAVASAKSTPVAVPAPSPEEVVERNVVTNHDGSVTVTTISKHTEPAVARVAPATPPARSEAKPTSGLLAPDDVRWATIVMGLIALGMLISMIRLAVVFRRLRRQLKQRRDVIEDPVLETFLSLCQRAGLGKRVRLTASPNLGSPVALWRREICLPERAVEGLSPKQQEGMLAHELAHIVRRDPAWLLLAAVVEAVFFFQPLNRLARRRMQDTAEYLCDDWAVKHTGSGVHLAKCLAEVASWLDGDRSRAFTSPMADSSSPIVRRIKRLLDERRRLGGDGHRAWRVGLGLGILTAVAWAAPGIVQADEAVDEAPVRQVKQPVATIAPMVAPRPEPRVLVQEDECGRVTVEVRGDEIVRVEVDRPPRREKSGIHISGAFALDEGWFLNFDLDDDDFDFDLDFDFDWQGDDDSPCLFDSDELERRLHEGFHAHADVDRMIRDARRQARRQAKAARRHARELRREARERRHEARDRHREALHEAHQAQIQALQALHRL